MFAITVNYGSTIPLYMRLYGSIIEEIASNHIHYGNKIPFPRLLASVMDLDLQTVNKSYRLLNENGIIAPLKNMKYVVTSKAPDMEKMKYTGKIKENK